MPGKNLERARSWFVLAEILGGLAGLIMLAGGFFYTSPADISDLHNNLRDFCNEIMQDDIPIYNSTFECRDKYGGNFIDYTNESNKKAIVYLSSGIVIAFFSIFLWCLGRAKLENTKLNDNIWGIILFIILAIIIYTLIFLEII